MEGVPRHPPAARGPRRRRRLSVSPEELLLAALFLAAAILYSSVGHAGASAYLAAMALVGVSPATMRPTALVLNLFVAGIVIARFWRVGHLPWRHLAPLAIGSVPMAFIGGSIDLPGQVYRPLVAAVLLAGAARLATASAPADDEERAGVPWLPGVAAGAVIGLVAGLTGTGGGVFLTPLLVLAAWTGDPGCCRVVGRLHPRELGLRARRPAHGWRQPAAGDAAMDRRGGTWRAHWLVAGSRPVQHPQPAPRPCGRARGGGRKAGLPAVTCGVGWRR